MGCKGNRNLPGSVRSRAMPYSPLYLEYDRKSSPSVSVEVTLRCACGTEKKVSMKVSEGVAVRSVQNYSCAYCTEARRLERDRGKRLEEAARLPEVKGAELFDEEIVAGN